jgi:hypothetical protein
MVFVEAFNAPEVFSGLALKSMVSTVIGLSLVNLSSDLASVLPRRHHVLVLGADRHDRGHRRVDRRVEAARQPVMSRCGVRLRTSTKNGVATRRNRA